MFYNIIRKRFRLNIWSECYVKKIGEKIKELRKSQDVTQEKLADYLNISYQAVSKWENGLALPDLSLIPALSNFFGVTSDYLLDISLDKKRVK